MYIDLNRFITNLVTYLQQKSIGRQTHKIAYSTKSAAHYKEKVFPDDEFVYATIKDEYQFIYCTPIKPNNIFNIKWGFGFCYDYPDYNIPN